MIGDLPVLRLETWFSRWEFAATHTFTASDAQTMSVGELLALAGRRDVTDLARLRPGLCTPRTVALLGRDLGEARWRGPVGVGRVRSVASGRVGGRSSVVCRWVRSS